MERMSLVRPDFPGGRRNVNPKCFSTSASKLQAAEFSASVSFSTTPLIQPIYLSLPIASFGMNEPCLIFLHAEARGCTPYGCMYLFKLFKICFERFCASIVLSCICTEIFSPSDD